MKHFKSIFCLVVFVSLIFSVHVIAEDASKKEVLSQDITQIIIGKWQIAPNKRAKSGSIVFKTDGHYEMNEKLQDDAGVGTKGEYRLNTKVTPAHIDLCLDKCNQVGSEWTTRFGIIRIVSNDKLEIFTSSDSNHPVAFPDKTDGKYSMILARVK
ncbi:hypothetical protein K8T06_08905 [bacterium]|nr:hypothetical protein [bacterium]